MGDSLSYAADMQRDRWLASPAYKEREELVLQHNALMQQVESMPIDGMKLADMRFLLGRKVRVDPEYDFVTKKDLDRLYDILVPRLDVL